MDWAKEPPEASKQASKQTSKQAILYVMDGACSLHQKETISNHRAYHHSVLWTFEEIGLLGVFAPNLPLY